MKGARLGRRSFHREARQAKSKGAHASALAWLVLLAFDLRLVMWRGGGVSFPGEFL
jgi:hypothetical protein